MKKSLSPLTQSSFPLAKVALLAVSGAMVLVGISTSALASESVSCKTLGGSANFVTARDLAEKGYLNLAFFSLDRIIRSSRDITELTASLDCLDRVQEKNPLVSLPDYTKELSRISSREKNPVLARYAFDFILQALGEGSGSEKSLTSFTDLLKGSPLLESAAMGLIASKNGNFQKSVVSLRKAISFIGDESSSPIKGLKAKLLMELARNLYALSDDKGAITTYETLFRIGAPMQDALIESAWSRLRSKNYVKSLGLGYELSSGKLSQFFAPESISIRAISFVENCRFPEARAAIAKFAPEYAPLAQWLTEANHGTSSLYETAIARSEKALGSEVLPEKIWSVWSGSSLFISLQSAVKNAFSEERLAPEWIASNVKSKVEQNALLSDVKKIDSLKSRGASRIEAHLESLNRSMLSRISRETERLGFVKIEASQGAGRDLVFRNANPGLNDVEKKIARQDRAAVSYAGKLDWGKVKPEDPSVEMWIDEIGNYEAQSLDRCKAKAEYKKLQARR